MKMLTLFIVNKTIDTSLYIFLISLYFILPKHSYPHSLLLSRTLFEMRRFADYSSFLTNSKSRLKYLNHFKKRNTRTQNTISLWITHSICSLLTCRIFSLRKFQQAFVVCLRVTEFAKLCRFSCEGWFSGEGSMRHSFYSNYLFITHMKLSR